MRGVKVCYRGCGFGPSVGLCGPDARPGRHDRGCAGARLSEQSAAQRAARAGALHRRKRAAGAVGLSPEGRASPRAPVTNTPIRSRTAGGNANKLVRTDIHGANRAAQRRRHRHADAFQRPADRQQDPRGGEPGFGRARSACGCSNRPCCCRRATIYMDYLRDSAIVEVQRSNVRVLEQTLKQTRDRFNVGEVTRTDVAQSEAQLAAGKTQLLTAEANLTTTRSNFRRIIGNEPRNAGAGLAGRSLPAGDAARRGRTRPDRKSERHRGDVRHRRQLSPGQGQRRRAVADGHVAGRRCSNPTNRP